MANKHLKNQSIVNIRNDLNNSLNELKYKDLSAKIIVGHYHLFKNAGTSVDTILENSFSSYWKTVEFNKKYGKSNSPLVKEWLLNNLEISAFSSHTALFPIPVIDSIFIIPIVFLRHPIDRIWSIYKFERKHKIILNSSIKLAKKYDFACYLNHQLDRQDNRSFRNFQTYRFSFLNIQQNSTELEKALSGFNSLPLVGIVDHFDLSMKLFKDIIIKYFPSFQVKPTHKNITSHQNLSLEEKLDLIKSSLDSSTYERLLESNDEDLKLYNEAKRKLLSTK